MTDRPDEQKLEVNESAKSSEKVGTESTIGDNNKQDSWNVANDLSHQNDQHPSDVDGLKAIDSFGINFEDGAVLTAKGVEQGADSVKEVNELSSKENLPPAVSVKKMMEIANKEHDHPTRYKPPPAKCNKFLDKVTHDAGMRVPWTPGSPPRSFEMNDLLAKSSDYERVWKTDYSNLNKSFEDFKKHDMQPGDLVIWDVPGATQDDRGISHCAIATDAKMIIYAGSQEKGGNGCGHCQIKHFSGDKVITNFGPPSGIYRYNNLTK